MCRVLVTCIFLLYKLNLNGDLRMRIFGSYVCILYHPSMRTMLVRHAFIGMFHIHFIVVFNAYILCKHTVFNQIASGFVHMR